LPERLLSIEGVGEVVPEGKRHHINVSEGDFDEFG
jgi:hypothetical protein